jgi:hypothetical protein
VEGIFEEADAAAVGLLSFLGLRRRVGHGCRIKSRRLLTPHAATCGTHTENGEKLMQARADIIPNTTKKGTSLSGRETPRRCHKARARSLGCAMRLDIVGEFMFMRFQSGHRTRSSRIHSIATHTLFSSAQIYICNVR